MYCATDYGPHMKPFFIEIPKYGLGQTICANKFWDVWDVFEQSISTHFDTVSPLSMFSINQPDSISKSQLSIWDLNLGRIELGI